MSVFAPPSGRCPLRGESDDRRRRRWRGALSHPARRSANSNQPSLRKQYVAIPVGSAAQRYDVRFFSGPATQRIEWSIGSGLWKVCNCAAAISQSKMCSRHAHGLVKVVVLQVPVRICQAECSQRGDQHNDEQCSVRVQRSGGTHARSIGGTHARASADARAGASMARAIMPSDVGYPLARAPDLR